jgi:hypothetical protein
MKVLLLHPADALRQRYLTHHWDLVVDLGRAPASTYDRWRQQANCRVTSLYDLSEEIEDLYCVKQLLQLGTGAMVDRWGIDWWDMLSLEIQSDLHQLILVKRLSKELGAGCQLYASRSSPLAVALGALQGARPTILSGGLEVALRRIRHYHEILSGLDPAQVAQVLEDKLHGKHLLRRRFARRRTSRQPVVLLPSAYINVSRTALAYAAWLPHQKFLLVINRISAKPASLPANVGLASLTSYRSTPDRKEMKSLLDSWRTLRGRLVACSEEFRLADVTGTLERIPQLLDWGIVLRDAWIRVFEGEDIVACLSADDSNPPSSIPLLLARSRGLPALACHHGALNYHMTLKTNHADSYLVKGEMERDYLQRVARVPPQKITVGGPKGPDSYRSGSLPRPGAPWIVFFTEPYHAFSWRADEIYADLLPRLRGLAQDCGLQLVLKLHPFESVKERRRTVQQCLGAKAREVSIISGPPSSELWHNTRFALTVQSSVVLECTALGIPVFLLSWLRDHYSGYVSQYARFGIGHILDSPEQISNIPRLLAAGNQGSDRNPPWTALDSEEFERLLLGRHWSEMVNRDEELESFSHLYTA